MEKEHNPDLGCGSKNRYQNGTLDSGNTEQNLRKPACFISSHSPAQLPKGPGTKRLTLWGHDKTWTMGKPKGHFRSIRFGQLSHFFRWKLPHHRSGWINFPSDQPHPSVAFCSAAESLTSGGLIRKTPLVGKKSSSPTIPWQNAPKERSNHSPDFVGKKSARSRLQPSFTWMPPGHQGSIRHGREGPIRGEDLLNLHQLRGNTAAVAAEDARAPGDLSRVPTGRYEHVTSLAQNPW